LNKLQFGSLSKPSKIGNSDSYAPCLLIYGNESWQLMKPKKDQRQLADRSGELVFFIRDLRRHYCETGTVQAKPHGEGRLQLGKEQLSIVEALVMAQPDALLEELCERFAEQTGEG